jgi:hypothetical protein
MLLQLMLLQLMLLQLMLLQLMLSHTVLEAELVVGPESKSLLMGMPVFALAVVLVLMAL